MSKRAQTSQQAIVQAAAGLVKQRGASAITVDEVARAAGCAKGLVHYHLKTKADLLEAVATRIADEREQAWGRAFGTGTPERAIRETWTQLVRDADDGTVRGWISLVGSGAGPLTDQAVKDLLGRFSKTVGQSASQMLQTLGLEFTIPAREAGVLLASILDGIGVRLVAGVARGSLEDCYAAAWAGMLSLTRPSGQ